MGTGIWRAACLLCASGPLHAGFIDIAPPSAPKDALFLLVGPVADPVNQKATVTFNVPASELGKSTPQAGSTAVQIQMGVYANGKSVTATLTANAPATLAFGAHTIPMSTITWSSDGASFGGSCLNIIPSRGAPGFVPGGADVIDTLVTPKGNKGNFWSCGVLTFWFDNTQIYPQGNYIGTVGFTATRTP